MSEFVFLTTICLVFGTILFIFGMKYFSAIQQAKVRRASDEAYRDIATRAVSAQDETLAALAAVNANLADVKTRLATVEKILREVE